MNQPHSDDFPFLQSPAMSQLELQTAALLSPAEVDAAFQQEPTHVRERVRQHWMLTGVVTQGLFNAMRVDAGRDIAGEVAILRTSSGAAYLIICSELQARQHRHVLPLYEVKVMEFLRFASREPFRMFVESASGSGERLLYTSPLFPVVFMAAREACEEMNLSRYADFVREMPRLIAHVMQLGTMRSIKGQPIREVDVSIFFPGETHQGRVREAHIDQGDGVCRH